MAISGSPISSKPDSAAFQMAGSLALKEAAAKSGVTMLEPIDDVRVVVDDEYVGTID